MSNTTDIGKQILNFFHRMRQTGELPPKTQWKKMIDSVDRINTELHNIDSLKMRVVRQDTIIENFERRLIKAENLLSFLMRNVTD